MTTNLGSGGEWKKRMMHFFTAFNSREPTSTIVRTDHSIGVPK